jgi:hypothetical protein
MKHILSTLLTVIALPLVAEPTCALCEVHKAYNKDHPGDYEYYDDYLKSNDGKEAPKKEEPAQKAK